MKQPSFLSSALAERATIVRMEILHLDDGAIPSHAVGPSRLEQSARRRVFDDAERIDQALARVAEASVAESSGDLDVRYGLVFTNDKGQRILSLYVDEFGSRGAAEGHAISLNGQRLIEFLASSIASPVGT